MKAIDISARLDGRVAIVTGAARGIGRAVAEALARAGAMVLAVDVLDSVMSSAAEMRRAWHGRIADVSDPHQVDAMVTSCISDWGVPDVLMNIAAISRPCPVREMTLEGWEETLRVNLTSVFLCTTAVLPHMIRRKRGSIVSFSSIIARTGGETSAHYAAAKAGVEGFSRSLAREVGRHGIRVNVIAPGMIETDMLRAMPAAQKEKLTGRLPLRRIGCPEDFAGVALLLASDAGSYITGQTIHVNGGMFMS
jgi:3-oxoacyl-[acyl-carrier protein] reductase